MPVERSKTFFPLPPTLGFVDLEATSVIVLLPAYLYAISQMTVPRVMSVLGTEGGGEVGSQAS